MLRNIGRLAAWGSVAGAFALLLALGTWQWQRHGEKTAQIAALRTGALAAPVALDARSVAALALLPPGTAAQGHALAEFTRVSLAGEYLPVDPLPVRATLPSARTLGEVGRRAGLGFFILSPLRVAGPEPEATRPVVFVNRGFAPALEGFRAPFLPPPAGVQVVTGLLRAPERGGAFTPADDPGRGEYHRRDPAIMARHMGLTHVVALFVDAETPGATAPPFGTDGTQLASALPNNHFGYALTWYGLALTLAGVTAAVLWRRRRGGD